MTTAAKLAIGLFGGSAKKSLEAKSQQALRDLFIRESRKQGKVLIPETMEDDFRDWCRAEKAKLVV